MTIQHPGAVGHPGGNRRVYVRVNHHGRRLTRTFNTRKAAEGYAAQIEADIKLGRVEAVFAAPVPLAPVVTFTEAATRWLALESAKLKASTLEDYRMILAQHIAPTFGARPLGEITAGDVETWWAGRLGLGLSVSRLNVIRGVAHAVFARAVASGLADRDPVAVIMGTLPKRHAKEPDWLTEAELTALLAATERHEPKHHPLAALLATAGLRLSEARGAQVGDLDLDRGRLFIRRGYRRGRQDTPKSGRFRVVDLPPSTVALLRWWLPVVGAEAAVRGTAPTWLFPNAQTGEPADENAFRRALARAATAASIPRHIRPHTLRHSYASLALQRGVPLLVVSRQLGHASIAITADLYGHLAPSAGQAAAQAIEDILAEGKTRNPRATDPEEAR